MLTNQPPMLERVTGRLTKTRAAGAGFGMLWGAVFGFAAHAATRGQRDFSSVRTLSAARYDLIARDGTAERARTMLSHAGLFPAS